MKPADFLGSMPLESISVSYLAYEFTGNYVLILGDSVRTKLAIRYARGVLPFFLSTT